jgi:hypothetical protein
MTIALVFISLMGTMTLVKPVAASHHHHRGFGFGIIDINNPTINFNNCPHHSCNGGSGGSVSSSGGDISQ